MSVSCRASRERKVKNIDMNKKMIKTGKPTKKTVNNLSGQMADYTIRGKQSKTRKWADKSWISPNLEITIRRNW